MNEIDDELKDKVSTERFEDESPLSNEFDESGRDDEHEHTDRLAEDGDDEVIISDDSAKDDPDSFDPKDGEEPQKPFANVLEWASSIIYAVALMLAVNLFIFRSITVRGDSMNNTLVNNDQVVVTNFFYTPSYGDIVVVQANKLNVQGTGFYGEPIIKRVIAVAGDTVRIDYDRGEVYRNGELLSEDYIKELTHLYRPGYLENGQDCVVPENCVFVMGDNRNNSNDSRNLRDVGFIDVDMIIGKAFVRFSPIKDFKWL